MKLVDDGVALDDRFEPGMYVLGGADDTAYYLDLRTSHRLAMRVSLGGRHGRGDAVWLPVADMLPRSIAEGQPVVLHVLDLDGHDRLWHVGRVWALGQLEDVEADVFGGVGRSQAARPGSPRSRSLRLKVTRRPLRRCWIVRTRPGAPSSLGC
jgi:hypothetical protein